MNEESGAFPFELINLLPVRVVLLSDTRKILWCNDAFEKDAEHSVRFCTGKDLLGFFRDGLLFEKHFVKSLGGGMSFLNIEGEIVTAGKKKLYVNCDFTPLTAEDGSQQLLLSYKDISAPQVFREKKQVEETMVSFEYYTKCILHEIRNPLMAITGASQLLGNRQLDEKALNYLTMISEESRRIQRILEEIEMVNVGKELDKRPVNIHQPLDRAIMVMEHLELRKKKNVQIVKEYDPSLPEIEADHERLVQVFINIVKNAVEASKENGKVVVETRFDLMHRQKQEGVGKPRKYLCVKITDFGAGIPHENLTRIFMPLFSSKKSGEGVGLAICHQIVTAHDGTIQVESEVGEYTTFFISLPFP